MDDFSAFLREKETKYRRRIYLTDRNGIVQAHPDPSLIQKASITDIPGIKELLANVAEDGDHPIDSAYENDRGRVLLTCRFVPEIDWFLLVETDERDALRSTREHLVKTVLIGLAASSLIILLSAMTVNRFHTKLEELASTDSLTGCRNRREFEERFDDILYRRARYGRAASLLLIDVDRFKSVNDSLGHQEGDRVLVDLARLIDAGKRPDDLSARLGGDEFAVAVEAGEAEAAALAERLRRAFADYAAGRPAFGGLGLSIGVAEASDGDGRDGLMRKADRALYAAKQAGRNRVELFSGIPPVRE